MAKLKFSINPKHFLVQLTKNLSLLFFVVFIILLIFEAIQIKKSVDIILNFNEEAAPMVAVKGVRINFDNYNQVVKRIQDAENFRPTGGIRRNPFNLGAPVEESAPLGEGTSNYDESSGLLQSPE